MQYSDSFYTRRHISNDDYDYDAWKCDDENDIFFNSEKQRNPFVFKKNSVINHCQ